jgi:hypothetical protein
MENIREMGIERGFSGIVFCRDALLGNQDMEIVRMWRFPVSGIIFSATDRFAAFVP